MSVRPNSSPVEGHGGHPARLVLRRAKVEDTAALAALHVRSWQWAYRGILPDDYLAGLTALLPQRQQQWGEWLGRPAERTWVAEREGHVVGFASTGPSRDPDAERTVGEVCGLYLSPEAVGQGIGRALFAQAVEELRLQGYGAATLWVLADNARARRFYEAAGWRADGQSKVGHLRGFELTEVRYSIQFSPQDTSAHDWRTKPGKVVT